jgi:hypothetical protein
LNETISTIMIWVYSKSIHSPATGKNLSSDSLSLEAFICLVVATDIYILIYAINYWKRKQSDFDWLID